MCLETRLIKGFLPALWRGDIPAETQAEPCLVGGSLGIHRGLRGTPHPPPHARDSHPIQRPEERSAAVHFQALFAQRLGVQETWRPGLQTQRGLTLLRSAKWDVTGGGTGAEGFQGRRFCSCGGAGLCGTRAQGRSSWATPTPVSQAGSLKGKTWDALASSKGL